MSTTEPTVVHARGSSDADALVAVAASTPEALIQAAQQSADVSRLVVAVDDAVHGDRDALVAVVSVLASLGVEHIESCHPQSVRRVFDTHSAISAGEIEVLET